MASRTRLYTRFRPPRTNEIDNTSKMINVVIMDIDQNELLINYPNIQIKVFSKDEIDACVDYITSELTNLYLFISSDVGNTLTPFIRNCPKIESTYILHKYENYQNYSYTTQRIQGIFYDIDRMAKQFQVDITKSDHTLFSEDKTLQNIDPQSAETCWYRFFSMVIESIRPTNIAKDEFTAFCREVFRNKNKILNQIEQFEKNYRSDQAIDWYSDNRNPFLCSFLNQTILTPNNFSNLFKSRLMIIDITYQLKTIQLELHDSIAYPVSVYRGMMMRANEIRELKSAIGNLIMFKQFFSTTIDREAALMSANCLGANSLQGVFFMIEIDSFNVNNKRIPFSYIGHRSAVQEEMEVLFSMYSTFQIKSVELGEKNVCYVDLEFVGHLFDIDFGERSIFSPHANQIFIRHLSKENKQFIAFQLLLDIILRLDQTPYAKAELLEFCRSKYHDKPKRLKEIDDFDRDYQSENAAKWYTKDSFLYRLLNESLRIETIDHIVKMRYYIHDLHNQLAELETDFIQSLNGKKDLTLYRGQTMRIEALNDLKENKDGFISMNSFLSVTQDEEVAFPFSGDGQTTEPDEVSVIYEMSIDVNIRSTPYAKIESVNPDEQEILFSMGSIFRIGDVEEVIDHAGVFRVKLTMVYIEDQLWNKLTAHLD